VSYFGGLFSMVSIGMDAALGELPISVDGGLYIYIHANMMLPSGRGAIGGVTGRAVGSCHYLNLHA
jgi:hypothetical protein